MISDGTAGTGHVGVITVDMIRDAIMKVRSIAYVAGPGVRTIRSHEAVMHEPVKIHRRRRGQSLTYHNRVAKKWLKRYGTYAVPTAYVIDNSFLGGVGRTVVAHPDWLDQVPGASFEHDW